MKVVITKSVSSHPYHLGSFVGDVIEVSQEVGEKLISAKRAEKVSDLKVIETPESKLPKKQTRSKGIPTDSEGAE